MDGQFVAEQRTEVDESADTPGRAHGDGHFDEAATVL